MGRKNKRKVGSSNDTTPKGAKKQLKMSDFVNNQSQVETISAESSEDQDNVFTSPGSTTYNGEQPGKTATPEQVQQT